MTASTAVPPARFVRLSGLASVSALVVGALVLWTGTAGAAPIAVGLGTAESFVVLAGAGVTNTGPTMLGGDIGTYPTPTITGVSELTIIGTNHGGDAVSQGAKPDVLTAYNTLAGQGPTKPTGADLTGQTLVSGVYNSASSIGLTGTVTLDAKGDPDSVFVFQAGSTLITSSSSTVALVNGAQACNVYWQVGSSATLGTNSVFRGNLLALTDISATTGATVEGRLLAINGAVTLDTNTITKPKCKTPVTPTTPPDASGSLGSVAVGALGSLGLGSLGALGLLIQGIPETPKGPDATDGPGAPQAPEAPGSPQTPGTPGSPQAPETPSGPEVPGAPSGPVAPGAPSGPETPGTSTPRASVPPTSPATPGAQPGQNPQVRQVPRGGVETGDGSVGAARNGGARASIDTGATSRWDSLFSALRPK